MSRVGSATRDDELFARVVAAPEDDAPRAVLADHWLEQGHPRGELIARQLRGDDASSLYEKNRDAAWLGPLAQVTTERKYRRGFLVELRLQHASPEEHEAALASRELAFVERIHRGGVEDALYLRYARRCPSLRTLRVAERWLLDALLAEREPWHLPELDLALLVDADIARAVADSPLFPRLESVIMGGKGRKRLTKAAQILAARGIEQLGAVSIEGIQYATEMAHFLAGPSGRVRTLHTNPHGGGRIVVRPTSVPVPGQRPRVRVELVCDVLYYAFDVLQYLRKKTIVEAVRVSLPPGVKEPNRLHERRVFDVSLAGIPIEVDEGWASVV